ncbi:hypothetical protein BDV28DRAFT_143113 [Aspergillus coremiiformis]|uniref:Secreted protein n=1 Tax=Aspergillus coremiiformis TaxID=138285 RepID=A0A5N6YT59_9EURO|nr:hypothetical protein BDV28DRAFT_143113 [Aspergillus coremiiformis]
MSLHGVLRTASKKIIFIFFVSLSPVSVPSRFGCCVSYGLICWGAWIGSVSEARPHRWTAVGDIKPLDRPEQNRWVHGLECVFQHLLRGPFLGCLEYTDMSDGVLREPEWKTAIRGRARRNTTIQKRTSSRLLILAFVHSPGKRANQSRFRHAGIVNLAHRRDVPVPGIPNQHTYGSCVRTRLTVAPPPRLKGLAPVGGRKCIEIWISLGIFRQPCHVGWWPPVQPCIYFLPRPRDG